MQDRKIHGACMTQNEMYYLIPTITRLLPYVDSMTIVDGGSSDDTIQYFRNWANREPKIRFFIHPWCDDFPAQRNNYVRHVGEVAQLGDWMATFDADEPYEQRTLEKLRKVVDYADDHGYNMIGLQCRSVSERGGERCWENLDEYWKELLIKWDPNFYYSGKLCHEGKAGIPHNILRTDLVYEHIKEENVIWKRGCRNSFHAGGGDNVCDANPVWVKVRSFLNDKLGINDWHSFNKYLLAGKIDDELRTMLIDFRLEGRGGATDNNWKAQDWNGSSEWREWYKYYFRVLHPEEEPEELKGERVD